MTGEDSRRGPAFYVGDCRLDFARLEVQRPSGIQRLTPLEAQVLAYLAERCDEVVPRRELLVQVWGYRASVSTRAPSLLMSRVRKKLGQSDLIQTFRGSGYRMAAGIWEGEPPEPGSLPDPGFATSILDLKRLRAMRPALEQSARSPGEDGIRARMALAWLSLAAGEQVAPTGLWRDAERAEEASLSLRCALLALRAVTRGGTWGAALAAVERIRGHGYGPSMDWSIAEGVLDVVACTAHARLGALPTAEACARRATDRAEMLGHPELLALATDRRAFLARRQYRVELARHHAHDAVAFLEDTQCLVTHLEITNNLGTLHYAFGDLDAAARHYARALEIADSLGGNVYSVSILASLVAVRLNQGRLDACEEHLEALERLSAGGCRRQHELRMAYHRGRVAIERGEFEAARQSLTRASHLADRLGERRLQSYSRLYAVWLDLREDAWDKAWEELLALPAALQSIGDREGVGAAWLWQGWCASRLGQSDQLALAEAETALRACRSPLLHFLNDTQEQPFEHGFLGRRCEALRPAPTP